MEEQELLRQVQRFNDRRYSGFIVRAAPGLKTPHLSPRWFDCFETVCLQAERLGLRIWLYLRADAPLRKLAFHRWQTRPGKWRKRKIPGELVAAFAIPAPLPGSPLDLKRAVSVTNALRSSALPERLSPHPTYLVLAFSQAEEEGGSSSPGILDLMDPASTQRFIEGTLGRYEEHCRAFLGKVIAGVYLETPAWVHPVSAQERGAFPWSPLLPAEFSRQHGYNLIPLLPALACDIGRDTTKVRQDFWQTVSSLTQNHYLLPLEEWCARRNLLLRPRRDVIAPDAPIGSPETSHPLSVQHSRLVSGGDLLGACTASYSLSGDRKSQADSTSLLEVSDAHFSRESADYLARLHFALSAGHRWTQVCVLFPERSLRAHYHPCGEDPLFDIVKRDFAYVCDLLKRMHYDFDVITEETLLKADLAGGRIKGGGPEYAMLVLPSVTTLSHAGWERIVEFYENEGKVAALGLLPMESEAGKDERLARNVQRHSLVHLEDLYREQLEAAEGERRAVESYPVFREHESGGRFCSFQARLCADQEDAKLRAHQIFRESISPDLESLSEKIIYQHRLVSCEIGQQAHLYFIVNTSSEPVPINLHVQALGTPEEWDAWAGQRHPVLHYSILDDPYSDVPPSTALPLSLRADEAKLITLRGTPGVHVDVCNITVESVAEVEGRIQVAGWHRVSQRPFAMVTQLDGPTVKLEGETAAPLPEIRLSDQWSVQPEQDNVLVLTDWQFRAGKHAGRLASLGRRGEAEWQTIPSLVTRHSSRVTPPPQEWPERVTYRVTFQVTTLPGRLALIVEPIDPEFDVWVNHRRMRLQQGDHLDPLFLSADITGHVRVGPNRVMMLTKYPRSEAATFDWIPGRARIAGSFGLSPAGEVCGDETNTMETGSWTSQGFPHYSGIMRYSQEVDVPAGYLSHHLVLRVEKAADVVEAIWNGRSLGAEFHEPFEYSLDGHGVAGANQLVLRIANTRANAILGKPLESGVLGPVSVVPSTRAVLR